jgi:hypothetical protein
MPIRDLNNHRGLVEVTGRAGMNDDGTVTAPFTGSSCLAYMCEIESKSRESKVWSTFYTDAEGRFVVDDGTGRVRVDASGAEFRFEQSYSKTVAPGDDLPDRLREFIESTDAVVKQDTTIDLGITERALGKYRRFTERRIETGDHSYVYGRSTPDSSFEWGNDLVSALVGDSNEAPMFVISDVGRLRTAFRIAHQDGDAVWIGVFILASNIFLPYIL